METRGLRVERASLGMAAVLQRDEAAWGECCCWEWFEDVRAKGGM